MALLLSEERSTAGAISFSPLKAIVNWLNNAAQTRRKTAAMRTLLQMDAHRLEDLGLNRQDVVDALKGGKPLSNRRAERARAANKSD